MATDVLADRVRVIFEQGTVPGLLFRVAPDRLRRHCADRSQYHLGRAAEKEGEIPAMEKAVADLAGSIEKIKGFAKDQAQPVQSYSKTAQSYGFQGTDQVNDLNQQIDRLRADIKEHRNKAASFAFMAESAFDQTYALEWKDLVALELAK